jgi:Uracil DNA glycosylase superfamily
LCCHHEERCPAIGSPITSNLKSRSSSSALTRVFAQPRPDITSPDTRTVSGNSCSSRSSRPGRSRTRTIGDFRNGVLGLTNIVQRPSAGIDALTPREYFVGRKRLIATVTRYHPQAVALLGVTIYRTLFPGYRTGRISLGPQAETLAGRPIFVLPNPSGRNAHYSYRTMLAAFRALSKATKTITCKVGRRERIR